MTDIVQRMFAAANAPGTITEELVREGAAEIKRLREHCSMAGDALRMHGDEIKRLQRLVDQLCAILESNNEEEYNEEIERYNAEVERFNETERRNAAAERSNKQ